MASNSRLTEAEPLIHRLENGMVLVAEQVPSMQSAALTLLAPSGYASDPGDRLGLSSLACDMVMRGAGERDGRALINDLEILGVERGESVGASQTSFSAATLSDSLPETLAIYADIVRRPRLPEGETEAARLVCLQELGGIEDEPGQRLMVELRRRSYPEPWGRSSHGDEAGIQACSTGDVRRHVANRFRPNGAILGVAGRIEWDALREYAERLFGDWATVDRPEALQAAAVERPLHTDYESNQCHIGIAFPSVPYNHDDYLKSWAAIGVLGGGSSSRLFTEVREKRGLCYTVSASLQTQRDRARVLCYAGTTAERAQETLDVMREELARLAAGITQGELDRLKARIKSGLIMQQESTASRSGSIARDWYHLGRVRPLAELSARVDELTAESINGYLSEHPPREFTFATLGPQPLEIAP
ncbi:MAG: pitrilysin family protein [Planctomycetota bacterium]